MITRQRSMWTTSSTSRVIWKSNRTKNSVFNCDGFFFASWHLKNIHVIRLRQVLVAVKVNLCWCHFCLFTVPFLSHIETSLSWRSKMKKISFHFFSSWLKYFYGKKLFLAVLRFGDKKIYIGGLKLFTCTTHYFHLSWQKKNIKVEKKIIFVLICDYGTLERYTFLLRAFLCELTLCW